MSDSQTPEPQDIVSAVQREGLEIARQLIVAGAPVFVAKPCPVMSGQECATPSACIGREYHLPAKWQLTVPSTVWLDRWRPGDALAVVGGHILDVIDEDPRSGGDVSAQEMRDAGQWPRVFGMQTTPSGGRHYLISPTGEHETNSFMPGLDLQSGAPGGSGRAFAFIAPTVKRSKAPETLGQLGTYQWVKPPDLEMLAEFGTTDDSIEGVRTRVAGARARAARATPADRGPFAAPSQLNGAAGVARLFTSAEALEHCRPALRELEAAPVGQIEERCNRAAVTLAHFVPTMWSTEQAMAMLRIALGHTAYDESHPASAWTVEKFVPVLDGRRPSLDPWKAELKPEVTTTVVPDAVPAQDRADWLESQLVTADELAALPAPVPLVYGLLDKNTEAWMIGAPGSFKSFIALDLAAHVGSGQEWHGHRVRQERVLYLAAEGAAGMTLRTRAWRQVYGRMNGVDFLPLPVQVTNVAEWAALVTVAGRRGYGFVIVDTQHRVTRGLDENSAEGMGHYTGAVTAIRQATEACVLTVHHTGRNGGDARGSSAIDGAQDTELKLTRLAPRSSMKVKIKEDKQKDQAESEAGTELTLRVIELGIDPETDRVLNSLVVSSDQYMNAVAGGPAAPEEWETGHGPTIVQLFKVLRDQGGQTGLTKAEARAAVVERFYGNNSKALAKTTYYTAWSRGQEKTSAGGDLVMVNVSGDKWTVDPEALVSMEAGEFRGNQNGPAE